MTETLRTLKMQLLLILVKVKKQINKKIVVASDKKRQQVRSNKQALSKVANSLKVMAETSLKRFKMMAEEDKKREKRYMAFRRAEAEKNWEHELRIAEIFARAAQSTSPPNFGFSRSVTLPLQQVQIFQTKRQDQQVLTIMILISLTFSLK